MPLGWRHRLPEDPGVPQNCRSRGLESHETVTLGVLEVAADGSGMITLPLSRCEELRGHLGLVEVSRRSGATAGEFEIVPDKMSEEAFQTLRAALERTWTRLIFDPDGASRLRGQLPSPAELWREIEKPIRDISSEPRSVLTRDVGLRRLEAVRRPSELTASVIRASAAIARDISGDGREPWDSRDGDSRIPLIQRPGRSTVLTRDVDIPENALVARNPAPAGVVLSPPARRTRGRHSCESGAAKPPVLVMPYAPRRHRCGPHPDHPRPPLSASRQSATDVGQT